MSYFVQLLCKRFSIFSSSRHFCSNGSVATGVDFSVTFICFRRLSSCRAKKRSNIGLNWRAWTYLRRTLARRSQLDWRRLLGDIYALRSGSHPFQNGGTRVEVNIFNFPFIALWQFTSEEAKTVTSLAPRWQRPPSSTCQCQVTISQVPPSITKDIANDYTLCVNANVCQEVSWFKAPVSCSMTNDAPNEGWTSMSVLKSRRDFNYSSFWLPAWPSVKTWTEVNYSDDVLSPYLAVYVAPGPALEMADCQRSLKY